VLARSPSRAERYERSAPVEELVRWLEERVDRLEVTQVTSGGEEVGRTLWS
jgi:hypothetical protein